MSTVPLSIVDWTLSSGPVDGGQPVSLWSTEEKIERRLGLMELSPEQKSKLSSVRDEPKKTFNSMIQYTVDSLTTFNQNWEEYRRASVHLG